jgi:outer membrane lipoprotein-sorting protein
MFRRRFYLFLFIAIFFLGAVSPTTVPQTAKEIISQMLDSIKHLKTLKYDLKSTERKEGKLKTSLSLIKMNNKPLKIYFKSHERGIEVLWPNGEKTIGALINPNAFPYMNLNLNPFSNTMRNGQHHTIFELGYNYFGEVVGNSMKQIGDKFENYLKKNADVKWNGHDCYFVVIDYADFKYYNHTAKKGETLFKLARAKYLCEFLLLEANEGNVKGYYDLKDGQVIKLSNAYIKKIELYIDKKTMLPINIKMSDEKGLFEHYEYYNLQINKGFAADEFSKNYNDYGF